MDKITEVTHRGNTLTCVADGRAAILQPKNCPSHLLWIAPSVACVGKCIVYTVSVNILLNNIFFCMRQVGRCCSGVIIWNILKKLFYFRIIIMEIIQFAFVLVAGVVAVIYSGKGPDLMRLEFRFLFCTISKFIILKKGKMSFSCHHFIIHYETN